MKNLLFVLIISLITFKSFSQKFDGYYITNSNDTIKCSFDVETAIFDRTDFERYSVRNRIRILNTEGKKITFKPNEINSFFIRGTKTGDYKFASIENKNNFYHEIIKGKLSYYKLHGTNSSGALGALVTERSFLYKDKNFIEMNPLNLRKGLGKQIEDYPELYQKWMDSNKYYKLDQFEEVVNLYNQHFEN
jgi:hypothetical protein